MRTGTLTRPNEMDPDQMALGMARGSRRRRPDNPDWMPPEEDIDRLYELPLGEFTAARNALAKELGGEEGKRVKALRKPSAAAWALNQAVRRAPGVLDEFLGAAEELRQAHEALLGVGD